MTDALRTVAMEFYSGDIQEATLHVIDVFDCTRLYRNWYVHGFGNVRLDGKGELHATKAKIRLIDERQTISDSDARWLADWCQTASHYSAMVYGFCAEQLGRLEPNDPPRILPEKLKLPDRLKKPHAYRLGN